MSVALRRCAAASAALAFTFLGIPTLAGTTGGLNGNVSDATTKAPIAGVTVTVTSPSQTTTVSTDASGHFAFISLAPDEYTVTLARTGYDPLSTPGIAVFADAQQTLAFAMHKTLRTIANVTSRSASSLVRSGTTADVYSINAAQQDRVSGLGGGGNLNSAYSAISTVPGAYVPANQSGYLEAVHVRGGDSDQVGYELDGVPVNRAFDSFPSGSISSLGQLELQVYTGATPAGAEAQGLAGFVNQVLKTGTYPGYGDVDASMGTPTFYHSLNVEAGGASPDRMFSYYVGVGGFNQDHRYVDQYNGAPYTNEFGSVLDNCPAPTRLTNKDPGLASCFTNGAPNVGPYDQPGYILGPISFAGIGAANIADRSTVINVHVGIPHKNDGGHDDIQFLYNNDSLFTALLSSPNDEGLNNFNGASYGQGVRPYYLDTFQYTGATGTLLPANYASNIKQYFFPSSPTDRAADSAIPLDQRDVGYNNQAIVKLQYQKNFGGSAYFRVYGYTYYSNYIGTGAISSWQPYTGFDSGDYELNSHTRGLSGTFADQINPQNLLEVQGSFTTSTSLRMYNEQMFAGSGFYGDNFAVLVDANNPFSGTCYAVRGKSPQQATPTTCSDAPSGVTVGAGPTFLNLSGAGNVTNLSKLSSTACGGGPCAYYVEGNGQYGEYNNVTPNFYGYSITDQWRPSDRWNVNLGLRLDTYDFQGDDTTGGAARAFWFNAFNQDTCFDKQTQQLIDRSALTSGAWSTNSQSSCSKFGSQYVNAFMQNTPSQNFVYNILQPRLAATYTVDPNTVLRTSYGKFNEQPSAAYEQYDALSANLPDQLAQFYSLGFNTPGHLVMPSISYNADFSIEHRFKNSPFSFKLTPFYRETKGQIENFYTNIKAGLISGLNVGQQTSEGFEMAVDAGDFNRNGLSGQLSFAYTNAYVRYSSLPYNSTVLSPINADIEAYNAFTSFCSTHQKDARCGSGFATDPNSSNPIVAAPCYTATVKTPGGGTVPGGAPIVNPANCRPGDVANPYWNAPVQPLLDPNANYLPFTNFPGGIGSGVNAFNYPYVATLLIGYKHDKWSLLPSLQFQAGNRYGAPETMPGIDPLAGCQVLKRGATLTGDPRYPYGGAGGSPYDATNCAGQLNAIPDSFTGQFDGIGAFRQPAQLLGNLRIGYDYSSRISLTLTMANLLQTCFGGQRTSFTYLLNNQVCSYTSLNGFVSPVGNIYNPKANVQPFLRYPYEPSFSTYNDSSSSLNQPFNLYFNVKVKI
jgi:Carboxypeptidase regulatory-like domain/TonB dependent receptor